MFEHIEFDLVNIYVQVKILGELCHPQLEEVKHSVLFSVSIHRKHNEHSKKSYSQNYSLRFWVCHDM